MSTSRPPGERHIDSRARHLKMEIERLDRAIKKRYERRRGLWNELTQIHLDLEQRFGQPIPKEPFLLDLLQQVTVEEGDVWQWHGMRNNKGLPTYRTPRGPDAPNGGERSVVRFLAVAFGLITDDYAGTLYPKTSPSDVNPWHRSFRRSASGRKAGQPSGPWKSAA